MSPIQVFRCPSCGANVNYDGGAETTITCEFCGTQVVVPEELRPKAAPVEADSEFSFASYQAPSALTPENLAKLKQFLQNGQKIEAIKLYREISDVGLLKAKQAVEKLESGQPLVITDTTFEPDISIPTANTQIPTVVKKAGAGLGIGCIAIIILVVGFVVAIVELPLRLSGSYSQALEAAESNPAVIEALGAPVKATWWPVMGSIKCGSSCSANYDIPISGSKKSGHIWVISDSKGAGLFHEGTWTLDARVMVEGLPTIDLTKSSSLAAHPQPTAVPMATQVLAPTRVPTPNQTATALQQTADLAATQAADEGFARKMIATQADWKALITEPFKDNHLNWFIGTKQDNSLTLTTAIKGGKYLWTIKPKHGNSYFNLIPPDSPVLGDFYATVTLHFAQGSGNTPYTYGLVVRHVDDDYAFFGIQDDGSVRILVVYNTGISQQIILTSPAVHSGQGQTNQLTVRSIGPDFVFLVNDKVMWHLNEDMVPGDIGLGVDVVDKGDGAQIEFSNFEVYAP